MTTSRTAHNPKGVEIRFTEENHKYETDNVANLLSVSSLIKSFFPIFDTEAISERIASRDGKSQEVVLAEWKAKANYATEMGTRVHSNCEAQMMGLTMPHLSPIDEREGKLMSHAFNINTRLKDNCELIGCEMIVFSERLGLAGTIDLAMKYKPKLLILDYKTNAELDPNKHFNDCLAPICHLRDSDLVKYALQLSAYELIMKVEGYIPWKTLTERTIIHIKEDGVKSIQLPDFTGEIATMILHSKIEGFPDDEF